MHRPDLHTACIGAMAQPMGGHMGVGDFSHAARKLASQVLLPACCSQPAQHVYVRGGASAISSESRAQSPSEAHVASSGGIARAGGALEAAGASDAVVVAVVAVGAVVGARSHALAARTTARDRTETPKVLELRTPRE